MADLSNRTTPVDNLSENVGVTFDLLVACPKSAFLVLSVLTTLHLCYLLHQIPRGRRRKRIVIHVGLTLMVLGVCIAQNVQLFNDPFGDEGHFGPLVIRIIEGIFAPCLTAANHLLMADMVRYSRIQSKLAYVAAPCVMIPSIALAFTVSLVPHVVIYIYGDRFYLQYIPSAYFSVMTLTHCLMYSAFVIRLHILVSRHLNSEIRMIDRELSHSGYSFKDVELAVSQLNLCGHQGGMDALQVPLNEYSKKPRRRMRRNHNSTTYELNDPTLMNTTGSILKLKPVGLETPGDLLSHRPVESEEMDGEGSSSVDLVLPEGSFHAADTGVALNISNLSAGEMPIYYLSNDESTAGERFSFSDDLPPSPRTGAIVRLGVINALTVIAYSAVHTWNLAVLTEKLSLTPHDRLVMYSVRRLVEFALCLSLIGVSTVIIYLKSRERSLANL